MPSRSTGAGATRTPVRKKASAKPRTSSARSGAERRRENRVACKRAVRVLMLGRGDKLSFQRAKLADCSGHGLGIYLPYELGRGELIAVEVRLGSKPVLITYTVRSCTRVSAKLFRIGAQLTGFVGEENSHDADALVRAFVAG